MVETALKENEGAENLQVEIRIAGLVCTAKMSTRKKLSFCFAILGAVVFQEWVYVTHVINPNHFYVRRVAEKKLAATLSNRINTICIKDSCVFNLDDVLEIGAQIFIKCKANTWCRATVAELVPGDEDCQTVVKCMVSEVGRIQAFLDDYGYMEELTVARAKGISETKPGQVTPPSSLVEDLTLYIRKPEMVKPEMRRVASLAIRCSLKDIIPAGLEKGWREEARTEFIRVVGNKVVEMRVFGDDGDSLLVDLKKSAMDKMASDMPISLREYLVFLELARFYSPLSGAVVTMSNNKRPVQYCLPVYPEMNVDFNAVVSHVASPSEFYIQHADNVEFLILMAKIQDFYCKGEDGLEMYCPYQDQACVALFEDDVWYRARIIGFPGSRAIEVKFVDFGNTSQVSINHIRKIKDDFFVLPEMVSFNLIRLEACASFPKCVEVWDPPIEESVEGPGPDIQAISALQKARQQKGAMGKDVVTPLNHLLETKQDLKVRVTHVTSPGSFFVQLLSSDSLLKRLQSSLDAEYLNSKPEEVEWKEKINCAVLANGIWQRGEICSILPENTVEVLCFDFGNKVVVGISKLRNLKEELIYGSLALECCLSDIRPAGGSEVWTATACDFISYYLTGALALMSVKQEEFSEWPLPVTLYCPNKAGQDVSIAEYLISEGLALKERKVTVVHKALEINEKSVEDPQKEPCVATKRLTAKAGCEPECDVLAPQSTVPQSVKSEPYRPPVLPSGKLCQMVVASVGDDGIIYGMTKNAEKEFEQLVENIQQYVKSLGHQQPYTWKLGEGCAVRGSDMLWHRGKVLEVFGGCVKVRYIDQGFIEKIPVCHIFPTVLFEDVPQLCIPCQLYGLLPVGNVWQPDAVHLLKELLQHRYVDVDIMELPKDPKDKMLVQIHFDGMSLATIMEHHQHAVQDKSVMLTKGLEMEEPAVGFYTYPVVPDQGKLFPVIVKHLETPNVVYITLDDMQDKLDAEDLKEALERVNQHADSLPLLSDFSADSDSLIEEKEERRKKKKKNKTKGADSLPESPKKKKNKKSKPEKVNDPERTQSEDADSEPSTPVSVNEKTSKTKKRVLESEEEPKITKRQKKDDPRESGKLKKHPNEGKKKQRASKEHETSQTTKSQMVTDLYSAESSQDEQGEISTELTDVLADEPVTDASVLELGSPEKAATASLKRGDTFSCSGESPPKLKAKQKKSKTQQPGEHRLKLQGIKNLINEKKGVRAESSQGKRESMQEKLNFLMETKSADAAAKTHKVSKSGTDDEPGFLSSDSNEGGSVVKRKIKNKALESTPKVSALKGKEDNPAADKVSSVLTRHEDSEKEETFTANLFEKFLLNCEEKDRAPKRQSVCPPLVIVEEKVEQSKATPKTQVKPEKKTKTTKEVVPVQRPEPEKVDKSRREPRTPDNAKPMKGCFDVVSPPQEVDDVRERREKAAVMSPGSEPPEETLFKWSGSAQRERRRKREDSEPRLYIAYEDDHDVQDTVCQTEKTSDSKKQVLNLGVDLKLDWMTLEDFQKHLNGEDEILSTTTISTSLLRDSVKNGDYLTVKLALNSKEDYNLDQEDSSGMSLAMLAAAGGQDDILRLLMKKGVKVNARQKAGTTALMHAAEKNFLTTVVILLEAGAHVNVQQINGETALMKACKRGNADIVRLLLEYGADCNILSKHQNSALHFAKQSNKVMVEELITSHMEALSRVAKYTIKDYFETRLALLEPVFPLACHILCEGPDFSLEFNYKPTNKTTEDTQKTIRHILGLLFSHVCECALNRKYARGCRPKYAAALGQPSSVNGVLDGHRVAWVETGDAYLPGKPLQDIKKQKKDSHFIYSFSPVPGTNKLFIRLTEAPTAKKSSPCKAAHINTVIAEIKIET
ncbi:RING finger protein 17 [Acipenser ruthenus]|uniref:RING finger protein 17 n=1 Tax=Acipenser ruthenus TaxID=7906 RepID=A0A662YY99_ACIRT|nr:RING finger protein 17 [Acipenser ruthenus]